MRTVYMPTDCDEEAFRDTPEAWRGYLKEVGRLAPDGTAEFFVSDILGTTDLSLEKTGDFPAVPDGTNFVTLWLDGDLCDQGDSVEEVVGRTRTELADYDWPMFVTLVFWRHHDKAVRLAA